MERVSIVTLGCSKNSVDSEVLIKQLEACGVDVQHNPDAIDNGVVLVNTCGFIGDAKEESIDMIVELLEAKEQGKISKVIVFGCLSQRYLSDLERELPEVDRYFGVDDLPQIVEYFGGSYNQSLVVHRAVTTPSHYAYVKVSEGCNWGCSYCAIPLIRGRHKSRPIDEIVEECEILAARGVKELILIAQDLTYYGKELYGERRLAELLERLCVIEGIEWIRLHYTYPTAFPRDVIDVMKRESKICKYLDMPLQHVNNRILHSMKRGADGLEIEELIATLRQEVPSIVLRTTMIVGYPGETESEFEELIAFIKRVKFDRLGVFAYSEEDGTAAAELEDDIPEDVKQSRVDRLMRVQEEIALDNNCKYVSQRLRVIVERCEGDYFIGRTEYDSPEVDNEVLVRSNQPLIIGNFYDVEITEADNFDIIGNVVE